MQPSDVVTVYWRPGCPYCSMLRRKLRRAGLATTEVNIWEDAAAAATVRAITGGDETVPTVVVAGKPMVNPLARVVLEEVRAATPTLLGAARPAPAERGSVRGSARGRGGPGWLVALQWTLIIGLLVASFTVDAGGRGGLSWALDGVALVVYGVFVFVRRRLLTAR